MSTQAKPGLRAYHARMYKETIRLYKRGWSGSEIADHLEIPRGTVYSYIRRAGIMRPKGQTAKMKGRLRMVAQDEIDRTVELYLSGYSTTEVALILGLKHASVAYRLRHAEVEMRTRAESSKLRFARKPRAKAGQGVPRDKESNAR